MKSRAITIILVTGFLVMTAVPVAAQSEAMYVAPDGNVGLGTGTPARQLHLVGGNAVFRMDRSTDTAAFLMVRTQQNGTPLKTFVVGTNASGSNQGQFIINDLGTAVAGGGIRRMTIDNAGDVTFTGAVYGADFFPTSSIRFKDNVTQIEDPLALTQQLEGVRFTWKDDGEPSLGFIAEDVANVLPEVVSHDEESGQALGLNYDAIVPLLVEAIKVQQAEIEALKAQQTEYGILKERLAGLEELIIASQSATTLAHN